MKKKNQIIAAVMTGIILTLSVSANVQAADKWKKAENAYIKFLKKYQSSYVVPDDWGQEANKENYKYCSEYAIQDMNGDGIPELLTVHDTNLKQGDIYIFTYNRGKVQKVKNGKVSITSSASGGWYDTYFCQKGHLHVDRAGGLVGPLYRTYRLTSKGKLVEYLQYEENWLENKTTYKMNGKKITAKKYEKYMKKCGTKRKSIDWEDNHSPDSFGR